MEEQLNVQLLSETLALTAKDENYLNILNQSKNYQIEESLYRDKLKSVEPKLIFNFQKHLKELEEKGVILIGYDTAKHQRIIKMPPLDALEKLMQEKSKSAPQKVMVRINNVSVAAINTIKSRVIEYLTDKDEKEGNINEVYSDVVENTNYQISVYQFNKFIEKFCGEKLIKIVHHGKYGKFVKLIEKRNAPGKETNNAPAVPAAQAAAEIEMGNNTIFSLKKIPYADYNALETVLRKFNISKDFNAYISEMIEEIIVTLITCESIPFTEIVFSENMAAKYQFLKENFKEYDGLELKDVLQRYIQEFIEKEYNDRYIMSYFKDIIAKNAHDAGVLEKLQDMISAHLKSMKTASNEATLEDYTV
jgi:hypothetical protein